MVSLGYLKHVLRTLRIKLGCRIPTHYIAGACEQTKEKQFLNIRRYNRTFHWPGMNVQFMFVSDKSTSKTARSMRYQGFAGENRLVILQSIHKTKKRIKISELFSYSFIQCKLLNDTHSHCCARLLLQTSSDTCLVWGSTAMHPSTPLWYNVLSYKKRQNVSIQEMIIVFQAFSDWCSWVHYKIETPWGLRLF